MTMAKKTDPDDGHTIDVGVLSYVGPLPAWATPAELDDTEAPWLNRNPAGTWEVWGYVNGRQTVLFSSGLDPAKALADLATYRETHGLRPETQP